MVEVVENLRLKNARPGLEIAAELQDRLPEIPLDADQVRQMLVNLVQNGIDAVNGTGRVLLTIRLYPPEREASEAQAVEIQVSDTGAGMSKEVMEQIFTPFYTTKQLGKGTGMGLAIVYGVVKMHAGDISVNSEPGKGTTFTIHFPLAEKPAAVLIGRGGSR